LTPNPILKVLSSMRKNGVSYLLMGGQACVLYGGAEFSRDTDLVVLGDEDNLARLQVALRELKAETIAVPPFEKQFLDEGLAVHFRCHADEATGMRVDVMTRLRGVADFSELWQRRTTMDCDQEQLEVLSLPDLVAAKKTQRDKDWSMIRRLVEANYLSRHASPSAEQIQFWFRELRTPELLIELARLFPDALRSAMKTRPALSIVQSGNEIALEARLRAEEDLERAADREYWAPLKSRLEELRKSRPRA
jgi:hypothetical protein